MVYIPAMPALLAECLKAAYWDQCYFWFTLMIFQMLCLIKNLLNYMQTIQSCLPGFVVSVTVRNYKQTYLSALQSWSKVWLLQFNIAKCKILRLGSNPPVMTYSLKPKMEVQWCWRSRSVKEILVYWWTTNWSLGSRLMQWFSKQTVNLG